VSLGVALDALRYSAAGFSADCGKPIAPSFRRA